MSAKQSTYLFASFALNAREGLLCQRGKPVALAPKAFDTLCILVQHHGHVVSKEDLLQKIWPDQFVEENNLSQNISQLRRALGEKSGKRFIETVSKRGYRFVGKVREDGTGVVPLAEPRAPVAPREEAFSAPTTRYARSGEVKIAWQVLGDGPIDLVFVMGWVSHLEYTWAEPSFARFLRRLSSFSRLILFDKRGTGLSDNVPLDALPTLEQRMDDLRAVLAEVGSERAALFGVSEGGPMSALFAATHPEKTSALVMFGTYAKRLRDDGFPLGISQTEHTAYLQEIERNWGGPVGVEVRAPSVAHDPAFRNWWATYLRMGASPSAALALTRMNARIDVRNVLPTIQVPSLVIHRTGDRCLRVEEGRYVASLIPNASYVELPGEDHLPFVGDQDAILEEVEEFLTGVRHRPEPERGLTTVLFVRSSGENPAALPERLYSLFRKEVEWFRGREIPGCGATFDGPARAVRCALMLLKCGDMAGIALRAALHTGECNKAADGKLSGLAADIAEELAGLARPGEVIVTGTVRDLVSGSGLQFEDRGPETLTKVPGKFQTLRVERLRAFERARATSAG